MQAVRRYTQARKCMFLSLSANRIKTHLWNQELPVMTSNQTSIRAQAYESALVSDVFKKHFLSFSKPFLKNKLCIFLTAAPPVYTCSF